MSGDSVLRYSTTTRMAADAARIRVTSAVAAAAQRMRDRMDNGDLEAYEDAD